MTNKNCDHILVPHNATTGNEKAFRKTCLINEFDLGTVLSQEFLLLHYFSLSKF